MRIVWIMLVLIAFSLVASFIFPKGEVLGLAIVGFAFGWALAKIGV